MGEQTYSMGLAKAKNSLSHRIETGGTSNPFLAQIQQDGGIVGEEGDRLILEKMEESANRQKNGKIDGLPLPCRTRDTTPNPKNGIYAATSEQKQEPENQSALSSEDERENHTLDGGDARVSG